MESFIKIGTISSINPKNCSATVVFEEQDNFVSQEIPYSQRHTKSVKFYSNPTVGENAICLFVPEGLEDGYIIGSFYNDVDMPDESDENIYSITFPNGAKIKYDLSSNSLIIESVNLVDIKAKEVKIEGNLSISGDISANNI